MERPPWPCGAATLQPCPSSAGSGHLCPVCSCLMKEGMQQKEGSNKQCGLPGTEGFLFTFLWRLSREAWKPYFNSLKTTTHLYNLTKKVGNHSQNGRVEPGK